MVKFLKIFLFLICILAASKKVYTPVLVFDADNVCVSEKTKAVNCL